MNIILHPQSEEPLYRQIYRSIREQIAVGTIKEGEALPSVRVAAGYLRVAVITVKTAYDLLEKDGYIVALPAKGCFVRTGAVALCEKTRVFAEKACDEFLSVCRKSGMTKDDILALICEKTRS